MQTKGKIVAVNGSTVDVMVIRNGACGENCANCSACANNEMIVKADCNFDVSLGCFVEIKSNSAYVFGGMLLIFILPIILPLAVYLLFCGLGTVISVTTASVAFILSLICVYVFSKNEIYLKKVSPKVIKVLGKK